MKSYYKYWGKARKQKDGRWDYHLLPYHCLDVAAVAKAWIESSQTLRGHLSSEMKIDEEKCMAWVLFFISLHDYGKFDLRFQLKARQVLEVIQPESKHSVLPSIANIKNFSHGFAGYHFFYKDFFETNNDDFFQDIDPRWEFFSTWIAFATGHHGILPSSSIIDQGEYGLTSVILDKKHITKDCEARKQWVGFLEQMFLTPVGLSIADTPPKSSHLLSGFCSVCDWIGSYSGLEHFEYYSDLIPLETYFEKICKIAKKKLREFGLISVPKRYSGIQNLLQPEHQPIGVQTIVNDLPISRGLTIIEAPTGSGKTETAIAYAWRLLEAGCGESMIFALPTQASANDMLRRFKKFSPVIFNNHPNLILAHGKSNFNETFLNLKKACTASTAQQKEEAFVQCGQWFSVSRKRSFLGQIGICTIDQVLLSVLPIKHNFVRSFGIGRSILIVDEVHAYDNYMYGLLEAVLQTQNQCGGSVILLSATLPYFLKQRLVSIWHSNNKDLSSETAEKEAYPLITCQGIQGPRVFALPSDKQPETKNIFIENIMSDDLFPDEALLQRIIEAARNGAKIAIICNLVDVAQQIAGMLRKSADVPVTLFHSRYRFKDRIEKESKISKSFGREREILSGEICVATQVVEQSLDFDFDWLITQICPVDLLFQRMGRLHRHKRVRPKKFKQPLCTILLPLKEDYGLHTVIYQDVRVLWRTKQMLLQAKNKISFPQAYREWIELVYSEAPWGTEPEKIWDQYEKFDEEYQSKRYCALQMVNSTMQVFLDTDHNVSVLTRDGERSLTVVPIYKRNGKLCLLDGEIICDLGDDKKEETINLNSIPVPASWRGALPDFDDDGIIWLEMEMENDGFVNRRGKYEFYYLKDSGLERRKK